MANLFSLRSSTFIASILVTQCLATQCLVTPCLAVEPSESLLPATTKGFISTHDVDLVREKFNETQLGQMMADPVMQPFVEDFKKQIGAKLEEAGNKLALKWADLQGVYAGEVALALIQPDPKDKTSHATALLVDITGKAEQAKVLLAKIDANQKAAGGVRGVAKAGGVEMTVYTQPLKAGEKKPEQAFYFIKDQQLIATDNGRVAADIASRFGQQGVGSLATVGAFRYTMDRNTKEAGEMKHHVRWFVEPFGYAEASRAVQGGRKKRGTDLLKILQGQGFLAVQGIGGYVFFSTGKEDILHRTFIYAPPVDRKPGDANKDKYDLAMRMFDFPNTDNLAPQPWVMPDVASYLSFNWKMKEAFEYSETLVDAYAGDKGVFEEIWLNLRTDQYGPKIDIRKELINHLGERATLLSDVMVPVDLKSERVMVLVEVKNPDTVAATVEKAFKDDPAAKKRTFKGKTIWEIEQEVNLAAEPTLLIEGAGFVSAEDVVAEEEEEKPILPNMAIAVHEGHLIVSTHVEFIEELIAREAGAPSLANSPDYKRVETALTRLGAKRDSFRFFTRTDESYRATYELLQQGKLPEAETILARLLNSMSGAKEDGAIRKQEIDGAKLPPFEAVKKYMGPGGLYAQSEDDGWLLVGCLLRKEAGPMKKGGDEAPTE